MMEKLIREEEEEDVMKSETKRITQKKKHQQHQQQPIKQQLKRKKMIDRFDQKFIIGRHMEKKKFKLLPEQQQQQQLPEDVIEKILLKVPANSISKFRYVSKYLWSLITNPTFVKLHHSSTAAQINNHNLLLISTYRITYRDYKDGSHGPEHRNRNYACKFTITSSNSNSNSSIIPEIVEMPLPFEFTEIQASCNGLLYLHSRVVDQFDGDVDVLNYIWNPCTKEYKELPPPPPPVLPLIPNYDTRLLYDPVGPLSSSSGFCGFGYDRTNDEYKILHYENLVDPTFIDHGFSRETTHISSTVEFKLYTLGKNTWTRIVDNPYKSFYFSDRYRRIGLLVNGALHWIMCLSDPKSNGEIVSFDFGKEVFREVQKPPPHHYFKEEEEDQHHNYYYESLQVLQECLCICKVHHPYKEVRKIDIWVLRDYDVPDSWTKSFKVVIPDKDFSPRHFTLLRYFENNDEILMLRNQEDMIMYDPSNHKTRRATEFNESIARTWLYYLDYTESLVSLNSGTYKSS